MPGSVSFTGTLPSGVRERIYMPGLAGEITCRDWQEKLHARAADGKENGFGMGGAEGRGV